VVVPYSNRNRWPITTSTVTPGTPADPSEIGLPDELSPYRYLWPRSELALSPAWTPDAHGGEFLHRAMPEQTEDLRLDSRWPALFPSPICFVTTGSGESMALEKVVGASIVNRFPYIVAVSLCRQPLSARHYVRNRFMELLEQSEEVAVQFVSPGAALDRAMNAIASVPDERTTERLAHAGLSVRTGRTNGAPVMSDAYLVYEARLVKPNRDSEQMPIYSEPWTDAGSHRIYYLEITAIQLREDIASGKSQIHWRSLPAWRPERTRPAREAAAIPGAGYQKPYTANYVFPSPGTIGFESDEMLDGMAVKYLPPLAQDQVEIDNDRARWPCFFPSSVGMITTWGESGGANVMPCGSTTIVSRHPLIISPCVSYAAINERYAPRATLNAIRRTGRFGCGVPYIDPSVLRAIKYCGNISVSTNPNKVRDSGLEIRGSEWAPILTDLPVHFDCEVTGEVRLGTHIMFLGEARRIWVRSDVTPENPLEWCPWPIVQEGN
jgi:flavin reductase (DIM6/NTAB) family NADH-FMN oxidoreductase RutF